MKLKNYLPSLPQLSKETLAVLGATLLAAWVISRFPAVSKFVSDNSVTVRT
jgi:uncharacterized protein (UPF0333 family)